MTEQRETILIKRYASRRLYNTQISDYVTLDEIATYIKEGKDVQIIDRKSGDDITRQYLLQIITDFETRGENVLPINVLTDIVRSYSGQTQTFIPDFLSQSFDLLKQQQSEAIKTIQKKVGAAVPSMPAVPAMEGFENLQKMQSKFLDQMMGSWLKNQPEQTEETDPEKEPTKTENKAANSATKSSTKPGKNDKELAAIKQQLAELQDKLKDL